MNESLFNPVNPKVYSLMKLFKAILIIAVGGFILSGLFILPVLFIEDFDINSVLDAAPGALSVKDIRILRYLLFIEQIIMFGLTGIITLRFIYPLNNSLKTLKTIPPKNVVLLLIGLSLLLIPLSSFTGLINEGIKFPQWMKGAEQWIIEKEHLAGDTIAAVLTTDSYLILLINIVMIAVLPAFCEEIVFRAVIQRGLQEVFNSGNAAVCVTSVLFSALHFQFYGFLPRLIIGLVLGYVFLWSGSLWLPVIVHFLNNLIPILGTFFFGMDKMMDDKTYPFWQLAGSAVLPALLVIIFMMYIKGFYLNMHRNDSSPSGLHYTAN